MKHAPKKVFILEDGEYIEISYEEFCQRKETDTTYKDKLFIFLHGMLMEVTANDYLEFHKDKRRQKYIDERSVDNGDFSYDMLTTDDFNGEDILIDTSQDIGDAVFQKTYTTETLPFVNKANNGEKAKYYVENTNPPIISKADFEMVQKLIKDNSLENQRKKAVTYPLTQKIRCKCGSTFKPLTVNGKKYWECTKHNLGRSKCDSRRIPEKDIYEAFITMINKLRICRADILPAAITQTERLQMKAGGLVAKIKEIDKQIAEFNNKSLVLARLNTKGIIRPAEYAEQSGSINGCVNNLRSERRQLLKEQDENSILSGLRTLNDLLSDIESPITEFDKKIFESMVEEITFPTDTNLCFKLIGNLVITETIPDRRRCKRQ